MWPDLFHRCTRRAAAALSNSGATVLLRKLNRLFRYSRAPFNTSKFGREMQSNRALLVKSLKDGNCPDLLDMFLAPVARDVGADPSTFSADDLLRLLENKSGQRDETQP